MGARSRYESIAKIVFAFTRQRTWAQAELARSVELQPRQLRKILTELVDASMPLEREEERPQVYWSVPKGWLPGGVSLSGEQVAAALGLLVRLRPGRDRDALLEALAPFGAAPADVVQHHGEAGQAVDALWRLVPPAIASKQALRLRYRSVRGDARARTVSPLRIDRGKANHLVAYCHQAKALRRFHFDRVQQVEVDACDDYVAVDNSEVDAFLAESVDGFHDSSGARELVFTVAPSAAAWVRGDLPAGLEGERMDDGGLRVSGYVAGLAQVARYVVGLGAEAEAETPALREAVAELARGALKRSEE